MALLRLSHAFALGYLLGTVPSADVVARLVTNGRVDLRESGSRNPGAVNAARVLGRRPGQAVLVADVAKGFASCSLGRALGGDNGAHVAGVGAVLGHCYPIWNGFRGGKGLATDFGQCLYTFPVAATLDLAVAVGVARIPNLRKPGLVSTASAAAAWLAASLVWWRRRWPNSWGPPPTGALVVANTATVIVIASRFAHALRRGHPDDLEVHR